MIKRLFDIVVSGAALFFLSPLLIPVVLVLRFTGEGEVFYTQSRVGRDGRLFEIYKFATMLKNSPNMPGGDITVSGDPRVLPFGRLLRKTKINELPQLLNVLFGDMSVIGPRPLTPRVAAFFPREHWANIEGLRPGLSGLGSIVFRDEEALLENADDRECIYREAIAPYKMALEGWYAKNRSLMIDLKLVIFTVMSVFSPGFNVEGVLRNLPPKPPALESFQRKAATSAS